MSRRDRHGSDDYDGQVGHFSQKIFRLKICFFATTLTKVAIIMTCICQIPCFALVCSPQGLFRWQDKHSWFSDRNKQRVCLAHILFQLTPIDTSTTTLYIGGNKGDSNWGQLTAAAVGEKRFKAENAHGNPRAGKEENHDAFRSTKSFSSRGEGITTFRNLRELIQL